MPSTLGILASSKYLAPVTLPSIATIDSTAGTAVNYDGGGQPYVTIPSGAAIGQVCYIHVATQETITITTPAGWTKVADGASHWGVYRKILTSGEPGSNIPFDLSTVWYPLSATVLTLTGANTTTPENVIGTVASPGYTGSVTASGPTSTVDNCLGLAFAGSGDANLPTWTVSGTGWTEETDSNNGYSSATMATKSLTTAGATGDADFTTTPSGNVRAVIIAVAPA